MRKLRILLCIRHTSYLRNLLEVIDLLARAGHKLHFVFDAHGPLGEDSLFDELCARHANITGQFVERSDPVRRFSWRRHAEKLRYGVDYLRYLDRRYAGASALRQRARNRAPAEFRTFADRYLARSQAVLKLALSLGAAIEWSLPVRPVVVRFFDLFRPDLVVVSPLVGLGSDQVDWVKEAKLRGIPSVLPVASWDNLTNKGRLRILPDHILVWNEAQKAEAVSLHGARPEQVLVCGAWTYDHWFEWQPSLEREAFLGLVGLEPGSRYLLYVGSSPFIAPNEVEFCLRLIRAIRRNSEIADLGILIRPHPQNAPQWEAMNLAELDNVAIFPKAGANPIDRDRRNQYFDSIWHSDAVFGINTSAQIEAGILARPVLTVVDKRFRGTQSGTLHFRHLTDVNGGLLHVNKTVGGCAQQIAGLLAETRGGRAEKSKRFVEGFIRPQSLPTAPSRLAAQRIEEAAGLTARPNRLDLLLGRLIRRYYLKSRIKLTVKVKVRRAIRELRLAGDAEQ